MKLNPDQRAAMHQWAVGGEMTDLTAAKALAAKFSAPFNPTAAQFAYYMTAAGVERRKRADEKRAAGIETGYRTLERKIDLIEKEVMQTESLIEDCIGKIKEGLTVSDLSNVVRAIAGLKKEIREGVKYMAILDKQWTEKKDLTSDGKPLQVVPTINVYASESKTD